MEVDGLVKQDLGSHGRKGQDHHGEIASPDVDGRHWDDVHANGDRDAYQYDRVDGVLAIRVVCNPVVDEAGEDVWRRCQKQADGPRVAETCDNGREEVRDRALALREHIAEDEQY